MVVDVDELSAAEKPFEIELVVTLFTITSFRLNAGDPGPGNGVAE